MPPLPELNARLIEHAQARMSHLPLRMLQPKVSAAGALPPIACLAALESFTLAGQGDGDMFAGMKLLFFLDALPTAALLPAQMLEAVDWVRDAHNFDL